MFNPSKPTADELNYAQAHKAFLVYDNEHVLFAQDAAGAWFIRQLASSVSDLSGLVDRKNDKGAIEVLISEMIQSKHINMVSLQYEGHVLFAQDAVGARFIHELESHVSGRSGIADGKEDEKIERLINERMQSQHIHVCAILVKLVIPPGTE